MYRNKIIVFLISFLFIFSCSDKPSQKQKAKIQFPLKFSTVLKDNTAIKLNALIGLKDKKSLLYFKKREKKIVHGLDLSFRVLIERQVGSKKKVGKALKKILANLTNKEIIDVTIKDFQLKK